jgi:hypothetical protein
MNLPSDPTTWDRLAAICKRADTYMEEFYPEEDENGPIVKKSTKRTINGFGKDVDAVDKYYSVHTKRR